jgi:hypothetical protein
MVYFHTKNSDLGNFFEGPGMENVGIIILLPLEYFTAIWYNLWQIGIFPPVLVCLGPGKIWQPCNGPINIRYVQLAISCFPPQFIVCMPTARYHPIFQRRRFAARVARY